LVQLEALATVEHVTAPPTLLTVRVYGWSVNVAVTVAAAVIDTVQVPVPEQPPPDQPVNVEPTAAWGVRTTLVPGAYNAEHVPGQVMPAGLEVTLPVPFPARLTVRGFCPTAQVPPGEVPPRFKAPFRQKQPAAARTQHPVVIPAAPMAV
jgi:hypothetical protein